MIRVFEDAPKPGTEEWRQYITASKIPAILGVSPWDTKGDLWLEMKGLKAPKSVEDMQDRLEWGHIIETSLGLWFKAKQPNNWQLSPGEVAYTNEDLPFPNLATLDRRARTGRRFHIVECKSSDAEHWNDGLPNFVLAQVQFQMLVSGIHEATVVVQRYSTVPELHEVVYNQELAELITREAQIFYESLALDEPPMPDEQVIKELAEKARALQPPSGKQQWEASFDEEASELIEKLLQAYEIQSQLEQEIVNLQQAIIGKTDGESKILYGGRALLTPVAGRFSEKNLPDDLRHLTQLPEVRKEISTSRLDTKAFKEKYPDVYDAGLSAPSWRFNKKLLES